MDNMPPLPNAVRHDFVGEDTEDLFAADQMHAYARAYAKQRVRPLVEALLIAWRYRGAMSMADGARIRAALAAEQEHSK